MDASNNNESAHSSDSQADSVSEEEPGSKCIAIEESADEIVKRSKYIPLRLSDKERSLLDILLGALEVSEYVDHVDVSSHNYGSFWSNGTHSEGKRGTMKRELKEMLGFVSGLYIASDFVPARKLVSTSEGSEEFFQHVFEIGRRYKVMNPDKMRTTYGKLMYLMQDAVMPGLLDLNVKIEMKTVYSFLKERKGTALLQDKNLNRAIRYLVGGSPQQQKEESLQRKTAREWLIKKYTTETLTKEDITHCLESLADSNSFVLANRHPVDRMLYFLKRYFHPKNAEDEFSLAIRSGKGGSELTHNHATQWVFVHQSLSLWREIQHEMFKLWICANEDLLGADKYRLVDTGQGLQRMLACPNVGSAMSGILSRVQQQSKWGWVGLSVVHLGDRDVPNALIFIDKYTQVPRILTPIVHTIERLHEMVNDPAINAFVEHFGGLDKACKMILADYFKHGFDGIRPIFPLSSSRKKLQKPTSENPFILFVPLA